MVAPAVPYACSGGRLARHRSGEPRRPPEPRSGHQVRRAHRLPSASLARNAAERQHKEPSTGPLAFFILGLMAKNLTDVRFAIRGSSGQVSSTWRLWVTRHGDVYLATRSMAAIEKYSFHKSGICRSAFTSQASTPGTMADRAMFKWRRLATPEVGKDGGARVAWLIFPTDCLSSTFDSDDKPVRWIEAAPAGGATHVELAFTFESQERTARTFAEKQERKLLAYKGLPCGEAIFLNYFHGGWENCDLNIPGDGRTADLVFSSQDPYATGRPMRIRLGRPPADGDALVLVELGGYRVPTPSPLPWPPPLGPWR
jgi:hypothetical protein